MSKAGNFNAYSLRTDKPQDNAIEIWTGSTISKLSGRSVHGRKVSEAAAHNLGLHDGQDTILWSSFGR